MNTPVNADIMPDFLKNVQQIGKRYFMPDENSESVKDLGYVAYCGGAAEVLLAVVTVFSALKTFHPALVVSAMADLTMSLSTNSFWAKHQTYLSPLIDSALNSYMDSLQLLAERQANPTHTIWDKMTYSSRAQWISVAVAIAYCMGGYRKMREVSLELRKELEAYV